MSDVKFYNLVTSKQGETLILDEIGLATELLTALKAAKRISRIPDVLMDGDKPSAMLKNFVHTVAEVNRLDWDVQNIDGAQLEDYRCTDVVAGLIHPRRVMFDTTDQSCDDLRIRTANKQKELKMLSFAEFTDVVTAMYGCLRKTPDITTDLQANRKDVSVFDVLNRMVQDGKVVPAKESYLYPIYIETLPGYKPWKFSEDVNEYLKLYIRQIIRQVAN